MDVTNSTLPAEKHPIDAVTVGRDVCYCLIAMMGIVFTALLLRKIAKRFFGWDPCSVESHRNSVLDMTDSEDEESEENNIRRPHRRQPRGIRNLRRELLGRPVSSRVVPEVEIGEEALPDDSSESESGLDPAMNFSTIRLPRYSSMMSLPGTVTNPDSPPSYELATSTLPSYEEATTIEVAENISERAQPPTYLEATMVEIDENLV